MLALLSKLCFLPDIPSELCISKHPITSFVWWDLTVVEHDIDEYPMLDSVQGPACVIEALKIKL